MFQLEHSRTMFQLEHSANSFSRSPKKPSPFHPIGTRIVQRNTPDAASIAASRRLPEALCTFWSPPTPCPAPGPTPASWSQDWSRAASGSRWSPSARSLCPTRPHGWIFSTASSIGPPPFAWSGWTTHRTTCPNRLRISRTWCARFTRTCFTSTSSATATFPSTCRA